MRNTFKHFIFCEFGCVDSLWKFLENACRKIDTNNNGDTFKNFNNSEPIMNCMKSPIMLI